MLDFQQNLLYSNLKESNEFVKKIMLDEGDDEQDQDIDSSGKFVILEAQLKNTILTSDILDALKKICSSKELSKILDCEVVTAAFYKKSDLIKDPDSFVQTILENEQVFNYDIKTQNILDSRTRAWHSLKLSELIKPIIDERANLKRQMRVLKTSDAETSKEKILKLSAKESVLKLIVNATYGVLASSYFKVGNSILANNITARARLWVWLLSRPLNGFQCITDGFIYSPDKVIEFVDSKVNKPGFKTLSSLQLLENHRCIKKTSLAKIYWHEFFVKEKPDLNDFKDIDSLASQHIKTFWQNYGLELPYELEHKMENIAKHLFYVKRAHYASRKLFYETNAFEDQVLFKFRGVPTKYCEDYLYYRIMKKVLFSDLFNDLFPVDSLEQRSPRLLRISDYKNSLKKQLKDSETPLKVPGYSEIQVSTFKLTNDDLPYTDETDYRARQRLSEDLGPMILNNEKPERIFMERVLLYLGKEIDYTEDKRIDLSPDKYVEMQKKAKKLKKLFEKKKRVRKHKRIIKKKR
jgi:hypothetical protein